MKRIFALFAASALLVLSLFGMAACSDPGEGDGETMPPASSTAPDPSVTTEPAAQETTGDDAGLTQGGADTDKGWGPVIPIS